MKLLRIKLAENQQDGFFGFRAKVMQRREKQIITVLIGIRQTGQTRLGGGVTLGPDHPG